MSTDDLVFRPIYNNPYYNEEEKKKTIIIDSNRPNYMELTRFELNSSKRTFFPNVWIDNHK